MPSEERSLWKAQHDVANALRLEARDTIKEAKTSWSEEVRGLKARQGVLRTWDKRARISAV